MDNNFCSVAPHLPYENASDVVDVVVEWEPLTGINGSMYDCLCPPLLLHWKTSMSAELKRNLAPSETEL